MISRIGTVLHELLRRPILVVFVALVLGGAGFAAAASLGVGSKTLSDAATAGFYCQAVTSTDGTTVSTTPTPFVISRQLDATANHDVSSVDVSGINPTCGAGQMSVALVDANGNALGAATITVPTAVVGTTFSWVSTSSSATVAMGTTTVSSLEAAVTFPATIPAANVAKYAVAISH